MALHEIAVLWSWEDGTRCVLCGDSDHRLELRVVRNGAILKRQPVVDLLHAIGSGAPTLEIECLHKPA